MVPLPTLIYALTEVDIGTPAKSYRLISTPATQQPGGGIQLHGEKIEEIYASPSLNRTGILRGAHVMMCDYFSSSWSITSGGQRPARMSWLPPPARAHFEHSDSSLMGKLILDSYTVWDSGGKESDGLDR